MRTPKYLHLYSTQAQHDADYNGDAYDEPWVALTEQTAALTYNKRSLPLEQAAKDTSMYDNETLVVVDGILFGTTAQRKMCLLAQPIAETERVNYIGKRIAQNSAVDCAAAVVTTYKTDGTVTVPEDATYILVADGKTEYDFGTREFADGGTITVEATPRNSGAESVSTLPSPYYIFDLKTDIRYFVRFITSDTLTAYSGFPKVTVTPAQIDMEYLPAKGKVYKVDIKAVQHASQILTAEATLHAGELGTVSADGVMFTAAPMTAFYTIVSRTGDGTPNQTITATSTPLMTQNLLHQSEEVWDKSGFVPAEQYKYTACSMTLIMDGAEANTYTFNVGQNGGGGATLYRYSFGGISHNANGWSCFAEMDFL